MNFFKSGGDLLNRGLRPSPKESATLYSVGFRKIGQDGNMYEVAMASNGVTRWKRVSNATPTKAKLTNKPKTIMRTSPIKRTVKPKTSVAAKSVVAKPTMPKRKSVVKPTTTTKTVASKPTMGKKTVSFKPSSALASVTFMPSSLFGSSSSKSTTTSSSKKSGTAKKSKLGWKLDRMYASKQKHEKAYNPKRKKPARKHGKQK